MTGWVALVTGGRAGLTAGRIEDSPRILGDGSNSRQEVFRLGLVFVFGALVAVVLAEVWVSAIVPKVGDHEVYMAAARDWLGGQGFYPAHELAGPFEVGQTDILYPPVILPLLVAFSVLPDIAWWLVPMAILGAVFVYWRPRPLGWLLILACLANPLTFVIYLWGNPAMWFAAFVALGTIYHWPSVLVLVKPTLAPFALVGIRHRSWWIALGVLALASLAFLPLWVDWFHVTTGARGPLVSPFYSIQQIPLMLTPLIARRTRTVR